MALGFLKSEDEVVYSTAEEEMWQEELESRKHDELQFDWDFQNKRLDYAMYGEDSFDAESKAVDYGVFGEEDWEFRRFNDEI